MGHKLRRSLSEFYFKDRVEPVTPSELAAAHHHGEAEALPGGHAEAIEESRTDETANLRSDDRR